MKTAQILDGCSRIIRRATRRFTPTAVILLYHRIADIDLDPWGLSVKPQNFSEHLDIIRKLAVPIKLENLAMASVDGEIPHRAVAVTFDDGYVDNILNGLPLLRRYGIPATVFLATNYLSQKRNFWWDELCNLLLQPRKLPEKLYLKLHNKEYSWELGSAAIWDKGALHSDRKTRAWEAIPGTRLAFYESVWKVLRPMPEKDYRLMLAKIKKWSGVDNKFQEDSRSLTKKEVLTLAKYDAIEIGAHTQSHLLLAAHSRVVQKNEIAKSKKFLEEIILHPVKGFSYPYGEFSDAAIDAVKEAGFHYAVTCETNTIRRGTDCFQLPRCEVGDLSGSEFKKYLSRLFYL